MRIGLAGVGRIGAFHAATLAGLGQVDQVVLTDPVAEVATRVADEHGYTFVPEFDAVLDMVDAMVIASSTDTHADLLARSVAKGLPTFCEKPLALTLDESLRLVEYAEATGVPVQVGFQRRFDVGHVRAREAVAAGDLGFVHTVRSMTLDPAPPPAEYIGRSGGIFRDCSVHDFDGVRFVTGREVVSVFAVGANKGDSFFADAGDVATGAVVLTLDDGTLALASATRYNGAGYDVRMDVLGENGSIGVGYDHRMPIRSVEPDVDFPHGPPVPGFMDRFLDAYRAELVAFCDVVSGLRSSPCTPRDAVQAFRIAEASVLSRTKNQPVQMADIGGGE